MAPAKGARRAERSDQAMGRGRRPERRRDPRQAVAEAWARQMRRATKRFACPPVRSTGCARSRTIADLAQQDEIDSPHVVEALGYCRGIDR